MLKLEVLKEKLRVWIGFDCCNTVDNMQSELLFGAYLYEQTGYRASTALLRQALEELLDEGKVVRTELHVCIDDNGQLCDVVEYELPDYSATDNDI
jgi:hypothetical protein